MKPTPASKSFCLIPFDAAEALTLKQAAAVAGKSGNTVRSWCETRGIGRRVVDGHWKVSKVALAMLLDEDPAALHQYLSGDRTGDVVMRYFARFNLKPQNSQNQQ